MSTSKESNGKDSPHKPPDPEDIQFPSKRRVSRIGKRSRVFLGEQASVGEAVVVGLAEDNVVEHADAEDF